MTQDCWKPKGGRLSAPVTKTNSSSKLMSTSPSVDINRSGIINSEFYELYEINYHGSLFIFPNECNLVISIVMQLLNRANIKKTS